MDFDFLLILLFIVGIVAVIMFMRSRQNHGASTTPYSQGSVTTVPKSQIAQDIKATKTSRVADVVEILDELGSTQSTYRHYCELIGTSMKSGGVVAPYSHREVAYYNVRCYRIENMGGRDYETLVAQESSIEPFYFTDESSDTPVYVDLDSFGQNVILVNSANHIEGPNSDFSNAFRQNSGHSGSTSSTAMAAVEKALEFGSNVIAGAKARMPKLAPGLAFMPAPAFAYAGANGGSFAFDADDEPANVKFAYVSGGPGKFNGSRSSHPSVNISFGGMPLGMREFMRTAPGNVFGVPTGRMVRRSAGADLGDVLVGMTLSSLLRSLNTTTTYTSRPATTTSSAPTSTFQGFRIVEDVVPLDSPTYCIGEIYRNGDQVYMGRSLATDYTTSFFACKPEAEVLSAIG